MMTWHTCWNTPGQTSPPAPARVLACSDHQLGLGGDVDNLTLRRLAVDSKIADLAWEAPEYLAAKHGYPFQAAMKAYNTEHSELAEQHWQELQAIWSRAWAANFATLKLLQNAGITTFSPVKAQSWVTASFENTTASSWLRVLISTMPSSPV
jgi:hypothetical protein